MTGTSPLREAWGLAIDLEDEYGTGPRATRRVQYASACTLSFGIPICLRRALESARVGAPSRATTALVPSGTEEATSTAASTIDPSAGRRRTVRSSRSGRSVHAASPAEACSSSTVAGISGQRLRVSAIAG